MEYSEQVTLSYTSQIVSAVREVDEKQLLVALDAHGLIALVRHSVQASRRGRDVASSPHWCGSVG